MPRLLHLNGPPGIGKTTLAHLWADRHPGTLVADIDALHQFVGGWTGVAQHPHHVLEPLAKAMIRTHLAGGYDVVMPQYLARADRLASFEALATETGAAFVEVVLLTDRDDAVARFAQRVDDTEWGLWNRGVVESLGGEAWLSDAYDRLIVLVDAWPSVVRLHVRAGAVEETYAALAHAVDGG